MSRKAFYENHLNFSGRTILEYDISPGIKAKFDILLENLNNSRKFISGIDLGCSGNSFLYFFDNVKFKSFFDIAIKPLMHYELKGNKNPKESQFFNSLCGDLTYLPYRTNSFDFICSLDTLEHIKKDKRAISEINRILRENGIVLITVPHRMKFFTKQDKLIGHFRRYEIHQILELFDKYNLKCLNFFGVYGQLMKVSLIQTFNPKNIEHKLETLRIKYSKSAIFRKFWSFIVKISSMVMKLDAKYHSIKKLMNIAFIFKKIT